MDRLYYLAKPTFGGWVTFTAHLSKMLDIPIHKVTKTTENKVRPFGYDTQYQNLSPADAIHIANQENILITAIDKTRHEVLEKFPNGTYLVIHDPTELKANKGAIMKIIDNFRIITIRETVQELLAKKGIQSQFIHHPYFKETNQVPSNPKYGTVSISRIDYDKNSHLILKANSLLLEPILIYGNKNDRYVYHKLKELDSMKADDPKSCYQGGFEKTKEAIHKILTPAKFVVDLSTIRDDGGGTQYTFLEAIEHGCALILNKKWITKKSIFKPGVNCFTISNEIELQELLNNDPDIQDITKNAFKILKNHDNKEDWERLCEH